MRWGRRLRRSRGSGSSPTGDTPLTSPPPALLDLSTSRAITRLALSVDSPPRSESALGGTARSYRQLDCPSPKHGSGTSPDRLLHNDGLHNGGPCAEFDGRICR